MAPSDILFQISIFHKVFKYMSKCKIVVVVFITSARKEFLTFLAVYDIDGCVFFGYFIKRYIRANNLVIWRIVAF